MSELISWNQGTTPAQLPVAIDYPAALALRQIAIVQDELPKYLLAPEVSALLHDVPDLHRKSYADFGPTLACEKLAEVHGQRDSTQADDTGWFMDPPSSYDHRL